MSPLQPSLLQQYQTHPNQSYRCQNHLRYVTLHSLPRVPMENTSKGAFKQYTPEIPKGRQVTFNSKGGQEPIAARKRSRVVPPPNLSPFKAQIQPLDEPVAARTRSRTGLHNFTTPSLSRALAEKIMTHVAHSVLDNYTGKLLNYGKLRKYPKYKETLNKYFSNKIGRLCQGGF